MSSDFHFLVPESFIHFLAQNGSVVSEKFRFEFLYVHDLGPRSRNDLDLQYSHTFMKSFSCLYLPTFRSKASIVSEKSTVFTFSYRKPVTKFDLAVKYVKVTPGSLFEQTMMGWSPRCYIPSFVEIGLPVLEKIFEWFLLHIWAWQLSWSCDPDAANKISFPLPKEAPHKSWL